jgi:hypothetical protein
MVAPPLVAWLTLGWSWHTAQKGVAEFDYLRLIVQNWIQKTFPVAARIAARQIMSGA